MKDLIENIKTNELFVNVGIKGRTPLLMHRFSEHQTINKNSTPREVAEQYLYKNEKGELYVPADCIYQAMINAGKFHKLGKNKITTLKNTLLTAGIWMETQSCMLGTKKYEVDSRAVVNANVNARLMCHRPRLDKWGVEFTLRIDQDMFNEKLVFDIVLDAGRKIGILAFRPSNKGMFGTFDIVKWEHQK